MGPPLIRLAFAPPPSPRSDGEKGYAAPFRHKREGKFGKSPLPAGGERVRVRGSPVTSD